MRPPELQRLGRLALEVDDVPTVQGAQHLTQVQVAVDPLQVEAGRVVAGPVEGRHGSPSRCSASDGTRSAAAFASARIAVEDASTSSRAGRTVRAERAGQVGVHRGDRLAQPVRLGGEVAADLVGAQIALAHQVPHAGGGHRPAVGAVGEELGEQAERSVRPRRRTGPTISPSGCAMCVEPTACSARWISASGFGPGLQPAKHLQDGRMPVDDRGVGLLRADHQARRRAVSMLGVRLAPGPDAVAEVACLVDRLQQQARRR